jgi:retinol dehydrogenase-12
MSAEQLEFSINPQIGQVLKTFFYSQLFCTPPYPTHSFANQTVIVTGSNVGLGLEAARHFYRLNCAKLILAVRTIPKGQIAKEDIVESVKHRSDAHIIELWPLDLNSTESTLAFAERVKKELPRADVLVENAGINNESWAVSEGFEQTIQVNVINTFLLALSLLPKMTETKAKFADSSPHLVIVSSEAHRLTKFEGINATDIYEKLNDGTSFNGQER